MRGHVIGTESTRYAYRSYGIDTGRKRTIDLDGRIVLTEMEHNPLEHSFIYYVPLS
jgi:hypothetical protein